MILFLHGIHQQRFIGKEPELLEVWQRSLCRGLKVTSLPVEHMRMGFYANLTDPKRSRITEDVQGAIGPEGFYESLKQEIDAASKTKDLQNTRIVHFLALLADSHPSFRRELLKIFAYESYEYLNSNELRKKVREKIMRDISPQTKNLKCIVAHSLGSVVAIDLLRNFTNLSSTLITIGSPLGSTEFIQRTQQTDEPPPGLAKWFDFYDEADIVPFKPVDPERLFKNCRSLEFDQYNRVQNWTDNRHGIEGYLSDAQVAAAIKMAAEGEL